MHLIQLWVEGQTNTTYLSVTSCNYHETIWLNFIVHNRHKMTATFMRSIN